MAGSSSKKSIGSVGASVPLRPFEFYLPQPPSQPPPSTPFASQDDEWASLAYVPQLILVVDDSFTEAIFPPTPPPIVQTAIQGDEDFVSMLDWRNWQADDQLMEAVPPPNPPVSLQDDDLERWYATWSIIDDGQERSLPPTPPPALQDDEPAKWISILSVLDDGQEPTLPPPPPRALQDDDPERWTGLPAVVDDGQETSLPPTPPPAFQIEEEMQRWTSEFRVSDEAPDPIFPPVPVVVPFMGFDDVESRFYEPIDMSKLVGVSEAEYGVIVVPPPPTKDVMFKVELGGNDDMIASDFVTSGGRG